MFRQFVHLDDNPPEEITYEVHLDPPYIPDGAEDDPSKWVGHYIGSAERERLMERVFQEHGGPDGARVLQVAKAAGCTWHLVRTWAGGRNKEAQLKQRSGKSYCPEPECAGERARQADSEPRDDYKTRRQRREAQRAREAPQFDPRPAIEAWETTYDELQERLRGGRRPAPEPTPEQEAEQFAHIERLEAQWRLAAEAAAKARELELEAAC